MSLTSQRCVWLSILFGCRYCRQADDILKWDHVAPVGLILGTRMWYPMWDAEKEDDAAFEGRVENVVREIGERGRLITPEAVPVLKKSSAGDMGNKSTHQKR